MCALMRAYKMPREMCADEEHSCKQPRETKWAVQWARLVS